MSSSVMFTVNYRSYHHIIYLSSVMCATASCVYLPDTKDTVALLERT